jgi:hypothetical protein
MSLPNLTLDHSALSPRLGYVFHWPWLQPYESVVGILWKFARMTEVRGRSGRKQVPGVDGERVPPAAEGTAGSPMIAEGKALGFWKLMSWTHAIIDAMRLVSSTPAHRPLRT